MGRSGRGTGYARFYAKVGVGAVAGLSTLGLVGSSAVGCEETHGGGDRAAVKALVSELQAGFVNRLEAVNKATSSGKAKTMFERVSWKRDGGKHGGGVRFQTEENDLFARASVNVSQVYYDDKPESRVDSATALSVILHPANPFAPSLHFHISYMQPRGAKPYWRMIADLNPSIQNPAATEEFDRALKSVVPRQLYSLAKDFGDAYFYIPALKRFRGVSHLFVAKLDDESMSPQKAFQLAKALGETTIGIYANIVHEAIKAHPKGSLTALDRSQQLNYHTLYLFQVLTLDRGTTHGLLAHSDNDVGTLGSLPNLVDKGLLKTWISSLPTPQDELLTNILLALDADEKGHARLNAEKRAALADVIRKHYRAHPEATELQAKMDMNEWSRKIGELRQL